MEPEIRELLQGMASHAESQWSDIEHLSAYKSTPESLATIAFSNCHIAIQLSRIADMLDAMRSNTSNVS